MSTTPGCGTTCAFLSIAMPIVFAWLTGCSRGDAPELASVYGTVTLDGKPLSGATIIFQPIETGRPSTAVTDENGYYELLYSRDESGAVVGTHRVRIMTYRQQDEDSEGNPIPAFPEMVPACYNDEAASNPEMKKTVEGGSNEIHFKLDSSGEIRQPEEEGG